MKTIEPVATWDVRPWGCPMVKIADFNGDGRNEILFQQSAGAHANEAFDPRSSVRAGYKTGAEDQDLFCITLTDGRGSIVWQQDDVPGGGHFGNFADIVGDGLDELLCGFSLYDHDGALLWAHEPLSPDDHLDDSAIATSTETASRSCW